MRLQVFEHLFTTKMLLVPSITKHSSWKKGSINLIYLYGLYIVKMRCTWDVIFSSK